MQGLAGIFSKFERDELNKITAKSILEKLMNVRQSIDTEFTARRLIWELMQNAKDNAALCNGEGEMIKVHIKLDDDEFRFSHDKGYFTNEHIRGLIRKYSSGDKERDLDFLGQHYKTTGRFGTGFMTTHLLSEVVRVDSYYQNDRGLYNKFHFTLDRSGKNERSIIEGINKAFDEAELSINSSSDLNLNRNEFYTSFTYPLTDKKHRLALITIEEVKRGIGYTLINVPQIKSVTIEDSIFCETVYEIQQVEKINYDNHDVIKYNLRIDGKESNEYYLKVVDKEVEIVIPFSNKGHENTVLAVDKQVPRLHLDFPMIGTDVLKIPFVINSPLFEPTEPRDGVSLIDDEEILVSQLNCRLVLNAISLYKTAVSYMCEAKWKGRYNLARVRMPARRSWIDAEWYEYNVIHTIRNKILYAPLVETNSGEYISIWDDFGEPEAYFPFADQDNVRNNLWELAATLYPEKVPTKNDISNWNEILWDDCYKFSLNVLSEKIEQHGNITELSESIKPKRAIEFLNRYYELLHEEGIHINAISADGYAVIPNQLGEFKRKSELKVDKEGIDEELKETCSLISEDPRQYLVHRQANTGAKILYTVKTQDDIITEINNIIKENAHDNVPLACKYLASLFPKDNVSQRRTMLFDFLHKIFPSEVNLKRNLRKSGDKIWEEADKKAVFYIVSEISRHENVNEAFQRLGFESEDELLIWLDQFVSFLVKENFLNNINRERHPILPNQNGVFCVKDSLFLDSGDIGEVLKDICTSLGYDFRAELLEESIYLELPENRTYSIADVADKISSFIKPILRDIDERKVYKDVLKQLYLWMNENRSDAEKYFTDLFEKRFLFLEDDDISTNIKKATELDQLMEEHGIKSIEDLRDKLSQLSTEKVADLNHEELSVEDDDKINITKEILVSLGVSSPHELEEALKDPSISKRFYHTSTPTTEMFIYAQSLIERAKKNIISYLKEHPDYDCEDIEELAPTILAGVTKNGIPIHIVTRPSDNGEVIIYYSSEKDTLDSNNAELWVDNNETNPHILTLGRILKSTGINRIPINMN